ncbi:MAG: glycosyltransferase family 4 protein [Calditrichaeota bacterium]|nr:glycosyltransferase family 4 protein [Calditrichota bacterium]
MNNHKRILMVLQSDFPPDIRLEKEIDSLTQKGHQIFLLCNNKKNRAREETISQHFKIIRLPHFYFKGRILQAIFGVPLFFNPIWLFLITKACLKNHINAIHVHDLPLALAAILIGKILHIPVIFDVHENYPAALKTWGKKGFLPILFRNPAFARKLEDISLKLADKVIVVVEEHQNQFISRGIDPQKIFIVGNTVQIEKYTKLKIDPNVIAKYKNNFVLTYVGILNPERELDIAIKGIKILIRDIPNLKLLLIGNGPTRSELEKLARKLGISEQVEFIGWVEFEQTATYIAAADICIIPRPSNEMIDGTVPHKLFQYMALAKPVITTDARAIARIVRETECGEIFQSHSAEDFASAVFKIKNSSKNYGKNGKKAVSEQYNWEKSSIELLNLYEF